MSIFERELSAATVVTIGHRPCLEQFHTRVIHLVRTPRGAKLRHGQILAGDRIEKFRQPAVVAR
jgi:putative ATP-binding cassette transporter